MSFGWNSQLERLDGRKLLSKIPFPLQIGWTVARCDEVERHNLYRLWLSRSPKKHVCNQTTHVKWRRQKCNSFSDILCILFMVRPVNRAIHGFITIHPKVPSIFPRCALSEGLLFDTPLPNSCFVVASGVSQNWSIWSPISWASTLEDISGAPSRLGTAAGHQQRIRPLPRQRMFAEFSVFRREPRSISKYHSRLDSLRYYQLLSDLGSQNQIAAVQQSKGPGDCACAFYGVLKQLQTDHVACSLLASPHPRWVAAVGLPGSTGEQRISSASGLSRGGSLPGGLPPGCASQGTWGCGVSDDVRCHQLLTGRVFWFWIVRKLFMFKQMMKFRVTGPVSCNFYIITWYNLYIIWVWAKI